MSNNPCGRHCQECASSHPVDSLLLEQFAPYLKQRGHRDSTMHIYLEAVAHFGHWFTTSAPADSRFSAEVVALFLDDHLPLCDCPPPVRRERKTLRAALHQLLRMHGQGPLPRSRPRASEAIEAAIAGFDAHLRDVCGLARETRESRCRFVRAFLSTLFGSAPLEWDRIIPQVLIDYITVQAQRSRPGTAGALACALRSYLRFLQFAGVLADIPSDAMPRPAHWSLAGLPPSLSDAELTRFWQAFDCRHALGQRDYAMARCLTDIALRCHEVADMRLEDIDWRAAVLSLPHTKSQRADRLPLPGETAQALLDYLRQGRPVCTSRAVFVYHRAPLGTAVASSTVQDAMERAFVRAGLPWRGTHVLRHTAATRLLQAGCSLKAIADMLRHRSIDTTAIYTKVDLPHLTAVALPWPEEPP